MGESLEIKWNGNSTILIHMSLPILVEVDTVTVLSLSDVMGIITEIVEYVSSAPLPNNEHGVGVVYAYSGPGQGKVLGVKPLMHPSWVIKPK